MLSGHQPCYLPSLQLFAKMKRSDVFVYCGHLQFQRGSWHNRNCILLEGKRRLLSIPVQKPHFIPIREVRYTDQEWKKKHLRSILFAYGKAPFFKDYFPDLMKIICTHPYSLEGLNIELTGWVAHKLGITTPCREMLSWQFSGDAVDMIIQMCQAVDADSYLSNTGSEDYISPTEEARMKEAGVQHHWLDWEDPDPEPFSAIHHLFMLGPDAARLIQ